MQGETIFNIIRDSSSPQIARVFQIGKTLTIITTEDADCRYSTNLKKKCNFNFESGSGGGGGAEHAIGVIRGKKYYIKCKDDFGNMPSGCSVIVQAT